MILLIILYALSGWFAAIFVNHVTDILPTRKSVFRKPTCLECGAARPVAQWSGLIAWSRNLQECSHCNAPRQTFTRSLIVEMVSPVIFAFLFWRYGVSANLLLITLYTIILGLTTVTDLEHRLIFNVVILPAMALAFAASFVVPGLFWRSSLVGGVGAFIVVYVAALLSRGGLGEGDVTLSGFLGFALGFPQIILSLTFGVFLGGFVAFLLLVTGRVGLKTFIPYGPFLTLTGWIMLVWGDEIWQHYFF